MKFFKTLPSLASLLFLSTPASACSVCFGNPNSLQSKGVLAGVLLLLAITVFVLGGAGFIFMTWARRAKTLAQSQSSSC